jgi:tRNA pseudouridine55 synthase
VNSSFFIFLDKPIGLSSHQAIKTFAKKHGLAKVGHHGTLDPFASGLLLVGVNEATKFFPYVLDEKKTYEATIKFGAETDTLDLTGKIISEGSVPPLTLEQIQKGSRSLVGTIEQIPPAYSAVKVGGQKMYELARAGKTIQVEPRRVTIFSLDILEWRSPFCKIRTTVSRGTYIRVLAQQIAAVFHTVAHLTELKRTCLEGFTGDLEKKMTIPQLLSHLSSWQATQDQYRDLYHGKSVMAPMTPPGLYAAFFENTFFGVGDCQNEQIQSLRLIARKS